MKNENYLIIRTFLLLLCFVLANLAASAQKYYQIYTKDEGLIQISGDPIDKVKIENGFVNFYSSLPIISGNQIPVLGWNGIPIEYTSAERYKEMADAGFTINLPWDLCFNSSVIAGDPVKYFNALDAAQANNMQIFVGAGVLGNFSQENRDKLMAHPALAGYTLSDEPSTEEQFTQLGNWVRRVQTLDKKHPCYINLGGNYGYAYNVLPLVYVNDSAGYNNSVRSFMQKVPVPMISFDHYPIYLDETTKQRKIRTEFYQNLEFISSETKKAGKPFWAFANCMEHLSDKQYPVPTINDLRLEVFSSLAYGAQCIQYFTYWNTNFGQMAPIDLNGVKTGTYYIVQTMNREIKNLSKVFLNAKMVWVKHTGEVPWGCTGLDMTNLPAVFSSFEITGGKGALVSLLEKKDDNFLVIVNHDINQNVSVTVAGTNLQQIQKDGSDIAAIDGLQTLIPGDILIYTWKK